MELRIEAESGSAAAAPRTAFRNDPQECGALRQGDIALIHSAPTGEKRTRLSIIKARYARACPGHPHLYSCSEKNVDGQDKPGHDEGYGEQRASVAAMGLFHRSQLLGAGRALMGRLPGLVGHSIDGLAALVLAHRDALGIS